MVAVIKAGHSMHRIFNYNENKVKEGVAECIGAENFLHRYTPLRLLLPYSHCS